MRHSAPKPWDEQVGFACGAISAQRARTPVRGHRRLALGEPPVANAGRQNAAAFGCRESLQQIGHCRARKRAARAEKIDQGSWKRLSQDVETVPIRGDGLCQRNTNRPRVHARARYLANCMRTGLRPDHSPQRRKARSQSEARVNPANEPISTRIQPSWQRRASEIDTLSGQPSPALPTTMRMGEFGLIVFRPLNSRVPAAIFRRSHYLGGARVGRPVGACRVTSPEG